MSESSELTHYIQQQLALGRAPDDIRTELRRVGWSLDQINAAFPATRSSRRPRAGRSSRRFVWGVVALVIVVAFSARLALTTETNNPNTTPSSDRYLTFEDPNFTMQVPGDWTSDPDYQPARTTLFYFSPENNTDRERAARMTVFVNSQAERIEQQLAGLADANPSIEVDERFTANDTEYRYVEVTFAAPQAPDDVTRIATVTAQRGDIVINADIIAADTHWDVHAEDATTMLKSITPQCDTKANPSSSAAVDGVHFLCGAS